MRHAGRVAASWSISNRCRPGPSNTLNMHVHECRIGKVQPRSPLLSIFVRFWVIWQLMPPQTILTVESEPITCWVELIVSKSIPLNLTRVFQGMDCAASLNSQANVSCRLTSVLDCFIPLLVACYHFPYHSIYITSYLTTAAPQFLGMFIWMKTGCGQTII